MSEEIEIDVEIVVPDGYYCEDCMFVTEDSHGFFPPFCQIFGESLEFDDIGLLKTIKCHNKTRKASISLRKEKACLRILKNKIE